MVSPLARVAIFHYPGSFSFLKYSLFFWEVQRPFLPRKGICVDLPAHYYIFYLFFGVYKDLFKEFVLQRFYVSTLIKFELCCVLKFNSVYEIIKKKVWIGA